MNSLATALRKIVHGNTDKQAHTSQDHLCALVALMDWLRQEGGAEKVPRALLLLAEGTARSIQHTGESVTVEVESLAQQYFDTYGGSLGGEPAGRWIRRPRVTTWWNARNEAIAQACAAAGARVVPELMCAAGGGRGNSTEYRFEFRSLSERLDEESDQEGRATEQPRSDLRVITYQVVPAKAARWVRWLSTHPSFPMRSIRGLALLGLIAVPMGWVMVCWGILAMHWTHASKPILAGDLVLALVALLITGWVWVTLRPLIQLPDHRVTSAPDIMLDGRVLYAQFKLVRNRTHRRAGGWFSLVRHSATCPRCSGDIDIADGGRAFPDRLVGRCADSPLEHVFSFDPVTLAGHPLRSV